MSNRVAVSVRPVAVGSAVANRRRHAVPALARHRVALVIETSLAPGREIVQGVARYAREHGRWDTFLEPRSLDAVVPDWIGSWDSGGIIARVDNADVAAAVRAAGVPVVDVLGSVRDPRLPLVHTDDAAIAQLAAEHLADRVPHHFAFVGLAGAAWSARRRDAFAAFIKPRARTFATFEATARNPGVADRQTTAALTRWLDALPKPVGIMLCSDQLAPTVIDACRRARVDVPGDAAIIGVDDDEPICEVTGPGLSSVWPDHSQVGYEAARVLDDLLRGRPRPTSPILVPPRGVVTRGSTDLAVSHDQVVAAVARVIHDRACDSEGLTIDDVAAAVSMSRSVLIRRFRQTTGRTLHDEILRVRLSRARTLLADTDLPIATVAIRAGFRHQEYLGAVFRQKLGVTPARYRRALRQ